jgi:hypothetical protein
MEEFRKRQAVFLLQLLGVTLVIYGVHAYLLSHFATEVFFFFPLWHIYLFHVLITTLLFSAINYRFSSGKKDIFNFIHGTYLSQDDPGHHIFTPIAHV